MREPVIAPVHYWVKRTLPFPDHSRPIAKSSLLPLTNHLGSGTHEVECVLRHYKDISTLFGLARSHLMEDMLPLRLLIKQLKFGMSKIENAQ